MCLMPRLRLAVSIGYRFGLAAFTSLETPESVRLHPPVRGPCHRHSTPDFHASQRASFEVFRSPDFLGEGNYIPCPFTCQHPDSWPVTVN